MVEPRDDIFGSQTEAHFNTQTLSSEKIYDRQCSNSSTTGQRVRDEIHPPDFVRPSSWALRMAVHCRDVTLRPLTSQTQVFLAVKSIGPVLADVPSFAL
jgi:hypothetical protein